MSRNLVLAALAVTSIAAASTANAAILYSDNFNGLTNGPLLGQGAWNITGTSVVNPIGVSGGVVSLTNTGQDANTQLTTPVTSGSVYAALAVNVSAAGTGDYFFHFANSATDSSLFTGRLFVKSSGTGYLVGFQFGSSGVTYGTTVLPLNTPETIVERYDIVSGATNDTAAIYVNPTDLTVEANNTAYATFANAAVSEPTQSFGTANLRQGGGSTLASSETLDSLTVATTFAEALSNPSTPVTNPFIPTPEPASLGALALGGVALLARRRK